MMPFSMADRMPVSEITVSYHNNLNTAVSTSDRKPTGSRVFPLRVNTKSCLVSMYRNNGGTYCVHIQFSWYGEVTFPLKTELLYPSEMFCTHFPECKLSEPRRPNYKYATPPKIYSATFRVPLCRILNI